MRRVHITLVLCFSMGSAVFLAAYTNGPPPGKTGSPGDNFINCSQCHNSPAQVVNGWISTDIPTWGYHPGQTYTVMVTMNSPGTLKGGFQICAEDTGMSKVGQLIIADSTSTKLVGPNHLTHISDGTQLNFGQRTWTVQWQAPASGCGDVIFHASLFGSPGGQYSGTSFITSHQVSEEVLAMTEYDIVEIRLIGVDPRTIVVHGRNLAGKIPDIELYSISGSRISVEVWGDNNGSIMVYPGEELHGIYLLCLHSGNWVITQKVISL